MNWIELNFLMIAIAYGTIACALLFLGSFKLPISARIGIAAILLILSGYSFWSHSTSMGYPTNADVTEKVQVLWIEKRERKGSKEEDVYAWVIKDYYDVPRAYKLPYDPRQEEEIQKARGELRKGNRVVMALGKKSGGQREGRDGDGPPGGRNSSRPGNQYNGLGSRHFGTAPESAEHYRFIVEPPTTSSLTKD